MGQLVPAVDTAQTRMDVPTFLRAIERRQDTPNAVWAGFSEPLSRWLDEQNARVVGPGQLPGSGVLAGDATANIISAMRHARSAKALRSAVRDAKRTRDSGVHRDDGALDVDELQVLIRRLEAGPDVRGTIVAALKSLPKKLPPGLGETTENRVAWKTYRAVAKAVVADLIAAEGVNNSPVCNVVISLSRLAAPRPS